MQQNSHYSKSSQRALVCSDVLDSTISIPQALETLCQKTNITCPSDAVAIVVNVLMLELGFKPKDYSDNVMPQTWKEKELYRLSYYHPYCGPDTLVNVVCVKFSLLLAVHGYVNQEQKTSDVHYNTHILVNDYIISQPNPEKQFNGYKNLPQLSKQFKDELAYPLLVECQEMAEVRPVWGFSYLPEDIKIHILWFLDAPSLLRTGCVNSCLYTLSNLPKLWKSLLKKDFQFTHPSHNGYDGSFKESWHLILHTHNFGDLQFQLTVQKNPSTRCIKWIINCLWKDLDDLNHNTSVSSQERLYNLCKTRFQKKHLKVSRKYKDEFLRKKEQQTLRLRYFEPCVPHFVFPLNDPIRLVTSHISIPESVRNEFPQFTRPSPCRRQPRFSQFWS